MRPILKSPWWAAAIAAAISIPFLSALAQEEPAASNAGEQQQGKQTTLTGKLLSLERYMISGDAAATASTGAMSTGPWAVHTSQGLVILGGDAATMWRGEARARADTQPREHRPRATDDSALGIERREPAQAKRSGQEELTLRASDPDANFRILPESEAKVAAGEWELDNPASSRAQRDSDASTALGVERRIGERESAARFPAEAIQGEVSITGRLYERDGIRFLKVEKIERHKEANEAQSNP